MSTKTIKSVPLSTQGQPLGVATLDASGKVPVSQLPAISSAVSSVNGLTGAVVVDKNSIGLGNVENTSDANKPISTAQAGVNTTQAATNSTQATINTANTNAINGKAAVGHTHPLSALTQSGATNGQLPQWNGTAWVPATIAGGGTAQVQANWTQTVTTALDYILNKPNLTAANLKLPTIIMATSGGDINNLQSGLDLAASTHPNGCRIYVKNGAYNVATTLLFKCFNVIVECESRGVIFNVTASTFIKSQNATLNYCVWDGGTIQNANATNTGICFDSSNWGVCQISERTFVTGFRYAQWIKDTNNQTFYSRYKFECFDISNAVYIDPASRPVNFNIWEMPEVGLNNASATNCGFTINNAQNNTFIHCAVEPFGGNGTPIPNTIGFKFGVGCVCNEVIQCYIEACTIGIQDSYANYSTAFGVDAQGALTELSKGNKFISGNASGNGTNLSNTANIVFDQIMIDYQPYSVLALGPANNGFARPIATANNKGFSWYDHGTNKLQYSNGTTWISL
jgi:hypothetical protein